jgi:hypothetical protein
MATFETRGVYHSKLTRAADRGLVVKLKGDPMDSKYKEGDKIVYFEVQGDDTDYIYTIENGDIHTAIANAPKGEWLTLFAAGSRDTATVSFETVDGDPVFPSDGDGPPPNEWPDADAKPAPKYEERRGNTKRDALTEALEHYYGVLNDLTNPSDKTKLIEPAQKLACTEIIGNGR